MSYLPYSNDNMIYSQSKHRYILTNEFVLNELNIDLTDILATTTSADIGNATDRFLDRVSKLVYNFLYKISFTPKKLERELALEEKNRQVIQDAMSEQIEWMMENGDLSVVAHLSDSGKVAERGEIIKASISPVVEDILCNGELVNPLFPRLEKDIVPDYAREGY